MIRLSIFPIVLFTLAGCHNSFWGDEDVVFDVGIDTRRDSGFDAGSFDGGFDGGEGDAGTDTPPDVAPSCDEGYACCGSTVSPTCEPDGTLSCSEGELRLASECGGFFRTCCTANGAPFNAATCESGAFYPMENGECARVPDRLLVCDLEGETRWHVELLGGCPEVETVRSERRDTVSFNVTDSCPAEVPQRIEVSPLVLPTVVGGRPLREPRPGECQSIPINPSLPTGFVLEERPLDRSMIECQGQNRFGSSVIRVIDACGGCGREGTCLVTRSNILASTEADPSVLCPDICMRKTFECAYPAEFNLAGIPNCN